MPICVRPAPIELPASVKGKFLPDSDYARAKSVDWGEMENVQKPSSTAISPRSAEAIWCPSRGAILPMSQKSFIWLCLSAACGRDHGILPVADGAAGGRGRGRSARARRLSRHPDGRPLSRDADQHRSAGGRNRGRHADRGDHCRDVSAAASLPRAGRADRDADLSAGLPRRGGRFHDHPAGRAARD